MTITIKYQTAEINTSADNSGIANGENQAFGWQSPVKQNNVHAASGMYVAAPDNINIILDKDYTDLAIYNGGINAGSIRQTI
ncbi:hypothetical protein JOD45_002742 [Scopulibacillus daqui]|uniref:Spore germination protein GerPA/GerPF n=1 Tax=Scopulibacillus daqui TaxID=1469162 RepID=A0ABS2Q2J4_9BACL|nr:hypothetical protein [Scopulibacillus daqui]MBM7646512.1 hypothetical protein [Scopulibacillus daqui]